MNTKHLLDEELLPALQFFAAFNLSVPALAGLRARTKQMAEGMLAHAPKIPNVDCTERFVPGPKGAPDVRVLVYTPEGANAPRPAYLHMHGGGYVMGSPEIHDPPNRVQVSELGCVIVSVDHRLAPETPFPGPVEDCYAVLRWIHSNAATLGVDPARIAVGGESSGGGLATCLAVLARDRGEVPIVHQQLIAPMLEDRRASSPHPYAGEFFWTACGERLAPVEGSQTRSSGSAAQGVSAALKLSEEAICQSELRETSMTVALLGEWCCCRAWELLPL